jgi:hypothetical protein
MVSFRGMGLFTRKVRAATVAGQVFRMLAQGGALG